VDNKVLCVEPGIPDSLPNPKLLRVYYGYDSNQPDYNGSSEVRLNVPRITFHTSAPGTVAVGEIWAVY
jgi:hypothetical protein